MYYHNIIYGIHFFQVLTAYKRIKSFWMYSLNFLNILFQDSYTKYLVSSFPNCWVHIKSERSYNLDNVESHIKIICGKKRRNDFYVPLGCAWTYLLLWANLNGFSVPLGCHWWAVWLSNLKVPPRPGISSIPSICIKKEVAHISIILWMYVLKATTKIINIWILIRILNGSTRLIQIFEKYAVHYHSRKISISFMPLITTNTSFIGIRIPHVFRYIAADSNIWHATQKQQHR